MLGGFMEWGIPIDSAGVHPIYFAKCLTKVIQLQSNINSRANIYHFIFLFLEAFYKIWVPFRLLTWNILEGWIILQMGFLFWDA